MPYRLEAHSGIRLTQAFVQLVIDEFCRRDKPRLEHLWMHYRNELRPVGQSAGNLWYRQGQEIGLPPRIVGGPREGVDDDRARQRREAVIENDIAWRVQAMVDFMFGKPVFIRSTARSAELRARIESALARVWERSGGIALLQDMALLGQVFGHVDLALTMTDEFAARTVAATRGPGPAGDEWLEHLRINAIDPRRGVPIMDERDYRTLRAYIITYERAENDAEELSIAARLLPRLNGREPGQRRASNIITEIISPGVWQVYENGRLAWEQFSAAIPGRVPVVHIQNIAQPFEYGGLGEVEPLIPLQDELNTRLSDRACRVTMQSFKMYLAKGIEGFENAKVGPGQIWSTDNEQASVEAFGGDGDSPSEDHHIREIREALDKVSGIPPLASGVVQAKIGNLSSANALRITLMAVLSKTARKRVTYGNGIARMCELVLAALDATGTLPTDPSDRGVELIWQDPLPDDPRERMQVAESKARLGVPKERIFEELGYDGEGAD